MATAKKSRATATSTEEKFVVASEIELVYKSKVPLDEMPTVNSAADAYAVFKAAWNPNTIQLREEFKILLLNNANKVLGIYHAFAGNVKSVNVDLRLIFGAAIKAHATSIVLAHNHPSGVLKPSKGDKHITGRLKFAASFLEINIIDHLIVSNERFYSMADGGEM